MLRNHMISQYISLPLFLASFAFGLFCIYVVGPEIKTVYRYPTPETYRQMQFRDAAGQCFEMRLEETPCTLMPKTVPAQQ
jgi:hypothetical protein